MGDSGDGIWRTAAGIAAATRNGGRERDSRTEAVFAGTCQLERGRRTVDDVENEVAAARGDGGGQQWGRGTGDGVEIEVAAASGERTGAVDGFVDRGSVRGRQRGSRTGTRMAWRSRSCRDGNGRREMLATQKLKMFKCHEGETWVHVGNR